MQLGSHVSHTTHFKPEPPATAETQHDPDLPDFNADDYID